MVIGGDEARNSPPVKLVMLLLGKLEGTKDVDVVLLEDVLEVQVQLVPEFGR